MPAASLALRADFLHCLDDPLHRDGAIEHVPDGVLVIEDGHVTALGPYGKTPIPTGLPLVERPGRLVVPGFVDTHVHYPQVDVIASHGTQLLDWLERYTFPAEMRFADADHARGTAAFFLDTLLANGTTTALVFATVHPASVDAFFIEAQARNLRMISGKVLMDRHAPEALLDTPASAEADSRALIRRWHGRERLGYAVTPRFAPTSTPEQLAVRRTPPRRAPGGAPPHPPRRERRGVRLGRGAVPRCGRLPRRLRALRPRAPPIGVRPRDPPAARRLATARAGGGRRRPTARCRTCSSAAVSTTCARPTRPACAPASAPTSAAATASRSSGR